jgi:hypothetical protein
MAKARCESHMMDIDQVIFDQGTIFARSGSNLQVFEAKTKTDECNIKGALRFPSKIDEINLQAANSAKIMRDNHYEFIG